MKFKREAVITTTHIHTYTKLNAQMQFLFKRERERAQKLKAFISYSFKAFIKEQDIEKERD